MGKKGEVKAPAAKAPPAGKAPAAKAPTSGGAKKSNLAEPAKVPVETTGKKNNKNAGSGGANATGDSSLTKKQQKQAKPKKQQLGFDDVYAGLGSDLEDDACCSQSDSQGSDEATRVIDEVERKNSKKPYMGTKKALDEATRAIDEIYRQEREREEDAGGIMVSDSVSGAGPGANNKKSVSKESSTTPVLAAPTGISNNKLRSTGKKNDTIDVVKQLEDAIREHNELKEKQTRSKLSNKEERLIKKLELRIRNLEEEVEKFVDLEAGGDGDENWERPLMEKYREKIGCFHFQLDDQKLLNLNVGGGAGAAQGDHQHDQNDQSSSSATGTNQNLSADLIVDAFSISIKGRKLFDDAQLKIVHNRRYGFLGPNGRGKTTLLYHLAAGKFPLPRTWNCILVEQEVEASDKHTVVEEVLRGDQELMAWQREERELIGKLEAMASGEQEGEGVLAGEQQEQVDTDSVEAIVLRLDELSSLLLEKRNAEADVRRILAGLGFTEQGMDMKTSAFSGGWRMRMSLAKALFLRPKLLLLDEPTNHLDLEATLWLEEYLKSYPFTILAISHDADFLDAFTTDIVALTEDAGLMYSKGGYGEYKRQQAQALKEKLKEWRKGGKQKAQRPQPEYVVEFDFPKLGKDDNSGRDGHSKDDWKKKAALSMVGIGVKDVSFGYPERERKEVEQQEEQFLSGSSQSASQSASQSIPHLLFDGLHFRFDTDSRVALVGPNGCGKTTLLSLLRKKLEPVPNPGDGICGIIEHSKDLRLGFFSQHFEELLPLKGGGGQGAGQAGQQGAGPQHSSPGPSACEFLMKKFSLSENSARASLGKFGLPSAQHLIPMHDLSGGQKARVCFAMICLGKPNMLMFDEPTNHLDIESVDALIDALAEYDGGVIMVSHDARLVQAITDGRGEKEGVVYLVDGGSAKGRTDNDESGGVSHLHRKTGGTGNPKINSGNTDSHFSSSSGLTEISFGNYVRMVLNDVELKAEAMREKLELKQKLDEEKRKKVMAQAKTKKGGGGGKSKAAAVAGENNRV